MVSGLQGGLLGFNEGGSFFTFYLKGWSVCVPLPNPNPHRGFFYCYKKALSTVFEANVIVIIGD